MFKNILFVCVGNICRSPVAEYWVREQLEKANFMECQVFSAGIQAVQTAPIAPEMQMILNQFNIDASKHAAKQIDKNDVARAEIIFTMETWQKEELSFAFPSSRGKIFTLGKWCNEEIIDPYRKEQAVFESVFESIKDNWGIWQNKLWNG
ncbi:MAG: protein tyrosine phosphatase [Gammaproteobacteria bacterium CG_4_10_14_0_8_um_filter_38_16]|nr:MAG: protein tyrosine phosphatase [Gammaproteobacteria bacterium CG_4_10_14_0_8_um_filter_38_16]PJA04120.1 MAG: protein tyrosine phosphatase [Gammaproteobacteria bacterium CG_4_10_14_0_2_um_filter_38_22]PJB10014.1 MAG: protein tyrosine phosphatase [Gammaproteobacteria bacterium CG_4_9_14_3_um_filter_38_9]